MHQKHRMDTKMYFGTIMDWLQMINIQLLYSFLFSSSIVQSTICAKALVIISVAHPPGWGSSGKEDPLN